MSLIIFRAKYVDPRILVVYMSCSLGNFEINSPASCNVAEYEVIIHENIHSWSKKLVRGDVRMKLGSEFVNRHQNMYLFQFGMLGRNWYVIVYLIP